MIFQRPICSGIFFFFSCRCWCRCRPRRPQLFSYLLTPKGESRGGRPPSFLLRPSVEGKGTYYTRIAAENVLLIFFWTTATTSDRKRRTTATLSVTRIRYRAERSPAIPGPRPIRFSGQPEHGSLFLTVGPEGHKQNFHKTSKNNFIYIFFNFNFILEYKPSVREIMHNKNKSGRN